MKLKDLQEGQVATPNDVRQALENNLVFDEVIGINDVTFIITDVPRISEEKYQQLFRVSFEEGSLTDMRILPYHLTGDYLRHASNKGKAEYEKKWFEWLEKAYKTGKGGHTKNSFHIEAVTWKEFVAKMKENYPPAADDFSE